MLADRVAIATQGAFRKNISVQQLLACFAPSGCDGGSPEELALWLAQTQTPVVTEQAMPYTQMAGGMVTTRCPKVFKPPYVTVREESVHTVVEFIPEDGYDPVRCAQNVVNMKRELFTRGPVYCALSVYEDLYTFTGRTVYARTPGSALVGGHAIEIIGYSDAGADPRPGFEKAHWICRNSWSSKWPTEASDGGYFAVEMGVNMAGIESRVGFAHPELLTTTAVSPGRDVMRTVRF
jgi:hypothetical protein